MEPVEINAGTFYLRHLRADDRVDDRPALVDGFDDPEMRRFVPQYENRTLDEAGTYITQRAADWAAEEHCGWAIAEPTTGRLLGEVVLKNIDAEAARAEIAVWVRRDARKQGVATAAVQAALRFGIGALDLAQVDYVCDTDNGASAALAQRCGFGSPEPDVSAAGVPSTRWRYPPEAGGR